MKRIISIMTIAGMMIFSLLRLQPAKTEEETGTAINGTPVSQDVTVFAGGNGKTVVVFQPGRNYLKNGAFHRYDLSFRPDESYRNALKVENRATAYFNLVSDRPYRLEYSGKYVEFYLQDIAEKNTVLSDNSLFFANVLASVDREIRPVPDGIKESLILRDSAAPAHFTYLVESNLTPVLENNRTVMFQEGETPYFGSFIPTVYDAAGASVPFQISLRTQDNNQLMDITLSLQEDSLEIRYPVVVDPVTYTWQEDTTEIHDNTITNYNTSLNYGRSPWLDVQMYDNYKYRTLLKFDNINEHIPANSTIDEATLKVYAATVTSSNYTEIYRLTQSWEEGNKWGQSGFGNWTWADSSTPWNPAGGAYYDSVYAYTTSGSSGAWHEFNVKGLVKYWYENGDASNKGMLLRQQTESGGDHGPTYCSSNYYADPAYRPILEVVYTPTIQTDTTNHIRYSSDYDSLQQAIDDTRSGDILYIDRDYTLTSTIEIRQRDVTIIGTKSWLQPVANGTPSPMFRIVNSGEGADAVLWNTSLKNLRFRNEKGAQGYGTGTAVEIYDDPSIENGGVSGIRLEDLSIENFNTGIHVNNAHNIFVGNCLVAGNYEGMRCESSDSTRLAGQIKVFGGYFINNNYHIHSTCVPGANGVGGIFLFGWTCGHQRNDAADSSVYANGATGVYAECPTFISTFGSHFEELDYAVHEKGGFVPGINAFANDMSLMGVTGVRSDAAEEIALIGNAFSPDDVALLSNQKVYKGILAGANYKSAMRDSIIEVNNGLIEMATSDSIIYSAFRIPIISDWHTQLPNAKEFLPGTAFCDTTNRILFISKDSSWIQIQ